MIWVDADQPTFKSYRHHSDVRYCQSCQCSASRRQHVFFADLSKPIALGADIVMHSTTKYIGGHSDIIGGAVMTSDDAAKIKYVQFAAGAVPGPFEAFLLLRSIKTLAIRMEKHEKNALEIAKFLATHDKVEEVFYPGLESHSHHALAKEQMSRFGGMYGFNLKVATMEWCPSCKNLKVFELAESLGGVESLINHPEDDPCLGSSRNERETWNWFKPTSFVCRYRIC